MNYNKGALVCAMVIICLLHGTLGVAQQNNPIIKYGSQVSELSLKDNLYIIAADALEGRKTGTRGQKMAAAFIRAHFEEIGLEGPVEGDYYQTLPLFSLRPGKSAVNIQDKQLTNFEDFVYIGIDGLRDKDVQIVFVGRGDELSLNKIDLKGKAALVVTDSKINELPIEELMSKGAKSVFVCNTRDDVSFAVFSGRLKQTFTSGRMTLDKPTSSGAIESVVFVSPSTVEMLLNEEFATLQDYSADPKKIKRIRKVKEGTMSYSLQNEIKQTNSENVLGYLEGSDKKQEVIVVTAHYDHIGKKMDGEGDLINNGADDDGSGTVAVMELARVFAKAKEEGFGPRRSMLFMTVTGEEIGLYGSEYYTENPVFTLANTVVDLNIDMIGRTDHIHRDSADYVYVIGSDKLSHELHQLSESINATYTKLDFDYTYNDVNHPTNLYKRSDHWNFAKHNIPIIFYFDGIHEDYHQPSDEVDKIDFKLLTKRTRLVFYTAWELANRESRIKND